MTGVGLFTILWVWALGAEGESLSAAVFVLSNGGQIEGELLNPHEPQRQTYAVRTSDGGRIVLPARLVERVESKPEALQWYEAERAKVPPTVEGHWAMAEACRQRG